VEQYFVTISQQFKLATFHMYGIKTYWIVKHIVLLILQTDLTLGSVCIIIHWRCGESNMSVSRMVLRQHGCSWYEWATLLLAILIHHWVLYIRYVGVWLTHWVYRTSWVLLKLCNLDLHWAQRSAGFSTWDLTTQHPQRIAHRHASSQVCKSNFALFSMCELCDLNLRKINYYNESQGA